MIVSVFVGKKCNEKALVVKKIFKFTNYRHYIPGIQPLNVKIFQAPLFPSPPLFPT
jgi:hypothetical protein